MGIKVKTRVTICADATKRFFQYGLMIMCTLLENITIKVYSMLKLNMLSFWILNQVS